jgi:hypothetical protein
MPAANARSSKSCNSKVITQYMCSVRAQHAVFTGEKCDPDKSLVEVMRFPNMAMNEKLSLAKAHAGYHHIASALTTHIKAHLKIESTKFKNPTYSKGALHFKNPSLYLKSTHMEADWITHADEIIGYEFLMFRSIAAEKATQIKPGFKIVTDDRDWSDHELIEAFEYKENGKEILGHIYKNTVVINKEASDLFVADKNEINSIIKNIFAGSHSACQTLKNTDSYIQTLTCNNAADVNQADYFVNFMTCLEIFNLATLPNFCD